MSSFLPMPITIQNRAFSTHSTGARGRSISPSPDKLQVNGSDWRSGSNATSQYHMRSRSPSVCSKTGKPLPMAPMAKFDFSNAGLGNPRSASPAPTPCTKAVFSQASPSTDVGPAVSITAEQSNESFPDVGSHALSRSWALWEKTVSPDESSTEVESDSDASPACSYSACVTHVKAFNSIESFMLLFNGVPPPSTIVNKNHIYRQIKSPFDITTSESSEEDTCSKISSRNSGSILGRKPLPGGIERQVKQLDAIMFFEDGVTPTWEDPAHKNGGVMEFTFKTDFPGGAVDEIWERVLFAVLGNSVINGDFITGVKMADRLPPKMHMTNPIVGVRFELWHREMTTDTAARLRADITDLITGPTFYGGQVVARRAVNKGNYATKTHVIHVRRAPVSNEREVREGPRRGSV